MPTNIEKDSVTGVETTGHTWDGISELNNPLPRWWLYVFYACIIWSIGYAVMFPSVPLGTTYFAGTEGYSARVEVEQELSHCLCFNTGGIGKLVVVCSLQECQ